MSPRLAERALGSVRYRLARRRMRGSAYRFEAAGACLCGDEDGEVVRSREELGRLLGLVLCRNCGLGRLSPRLAEQDLARYYESDYRTLIRGTSAIDEAYYERGLRRGRRLVEHLRELGSLPEPGSPVLEVGAGSGGILGAFRDEGHPVAGSDLDPQCVAFARSRGLDVVLGESLDAAAPAPAGLVVLSHLVEHLPDPAATLAALGPHMDERTLLYVEVPGLRSGAPGELPQVPHLFYYDLTTLSWLLGRAGYRLEHGDEQVRAVFRRAEGPVAVDTSGNFERNAAAVRALAG